MVECLHENQSEGGGMLAQKSVRGWQIVLHKDHSETDVIFVQNQSVANGI